MSSTITSNDTTTQAAPRWDLDSIFPGGSASGKFVEFRKRLTLDLETAEKQAETLPRGTDTAARSAWIPFVLLLQDLGVRLSTASSYTGCLTSQDVHDDAAHAMAAQMDLLKSRWQGLSTALESFAIALDDATWSDWLEDERLTEIHFYLDELRTRGREKMAPELERLAQQLAVDGYHAWEHLYDRIAGDLTVEFAAEGEPRTISLGQLAMYLSNSQRDIRREAFVKLEEAWESRASLAAMALNNQGGFRLSLYAKRGWDSYLQEPLNLGRIGRETLDAMWDAVRDAVPRLVPYIEAKKTLLGIDEFRWYDQTAPVGGTGRTFGFAEAGQVIRDRLAGFSSDMASFTDKALAERWIEAENRPGKAGGGFCTDFPTHRATRIFMTWGGEYDHLMTLAHELGHAYHGWVLRDAPYFNQQYPMNLAETASTFNELCVTDAALHAASDPSERLMLLDQKLGNAYVFFCNLRARFLFDCAFYEERAGGMVPRARLDELMLASQREAFGGTLHDPDGLHPLFWCSKLHFYITGYPFYNWPYVFGYLFANGVYDRAQKEGPAFADGYRRLLADTGSMTSEEVAQKHLGVDLANRDFWDAAVERILADVEPFVNQARDAG